ncbi:arsenate reductase family protein [Ovoidimarina sediminis]|uniref:arsenate reductase family protein n=1 Tax=Ovoidimarina sediminis TaxID=3079856 RepID=UPI002909FA71|nr:ArsC/Spx/MgsR family protein [Rhodophyticola sp. MJ-SS7]MDU8943412.1 ArsC/Spx/MgsR family protein [Rhodophyticola sp. MJ-SS7]
MSRNLPNPPVDLLGIPSCDTTRRALKALAEKGVEFRDVRADPLTPEERAVLLERFGEDLINRRSTTWRGLDAGERAQDPDALLAAHPTLMKRPVIRMGDAWYLGWDSAVQAKLLG